MRNPSAMSRDNFAIRFARTTSVSTHEWSSLRELTLISHVVGLSLSPLSFVKLAYQSLNDRTRPTCIPYTSLMLTPDSDSKKRSMGVGGNSTCPASATDGLAASPERSTLTAGIALGTLPVGIALGALPEGISLGALTAGGVLTAGIALGALP